MRVPFSEFRSAPEGGHEIDYGYSGPVYLRGRKLGRFHNCNSNYPCTVEHGGWSGGFNTLKEALTELFTRSQNLNVEVNIDNLFPSEYWILRLGQITMLASPTPDTKPVIRCRLYFNSHNTTGTSTASKPALYSAASIDPETFEITCDKKMPRDFERFENEKEMMAKLKEELECLA